MGLSRADAAEKIGISDDGLYKIETDKNGARLETLERIARAYNLLVGDLLPNTSTPIGSELAPIAAAFVGLSRAEIRDVVLNLASQARLMASWRFAPRDENPSTEITVPPYNTRPINSGKTDEPREPVGERGGSSSSNHAPTVPRRATTHPAIKGKASR